MKSWMKKLVDQLGMDWGEEGRPTETPQKELSEEAATLLFILDTFNKHLFDFKDYPVREVRQTLDECSRSLVESKDEELQKALFRIRQFVSSYRVDEYTYVQKTFDDFKKIIWDFIDQLSADVAMERASDQEVRENLDDLKDAVEANSIDEIRTKSREFIDYYTEHQTVKEQRRNDKIVAIKGNLDNIKEKLNEANQSMRVDHLTSAFNRKSFDEKLREAKQNSLEEQNAWSLIILDIDHFKKVNDTYGHDVGDFILKECVGVLQNEFSDDKHFVARIGGEEFAILLKNHTLADTELLAAAALTRIQKEIFLIQDRELKFTVSMGLAELSQNETVGDWMKRADAALYESKNSGRNRLTLSGSLPLRVAS